MYHHLNYGFLIERTGKKLKQTLQRIFNEIGADITVDQWVILYELNEHGSLSQNQIGKNTYKDAPTVTRIIDLLAKKGLVERTMSGADRRKYFIELTKKGNKMIDQLLPQVMEFRKNGWKSLRKADLETLNNLLDKIFENMNKEYE
ncbi:MAG: MarR family transcriptional regulator [Bacteroidetes bacterium]|nr:MarR family transcriptional regulator [Bacteroidota bacterium]